MDWDAGYVDVPSAGTAVRVNNTPQKVLWIRFKAETGTIYVGKSDVSSTNGWPVTTAANVDLTFDYGAQGGSVKMDTFYVDAASNGDNVSYAVIYG